MTKFISGSGGKGGGGGGSVTEDEDSLLSIQYASVLDLISEGEIQGLEDGLKSVYFDGTPIKSASGENNFKRYSYEFRPGSQYQSFISSKDSISNEVSVNLQVLKNAPITRTVTNSAVDKVRVTLQLPALQIIQNDGDIEGYNVRIKINIKKNGSIIWEEKFDRVINGKTGSSWQKDYIIDMPANPAEFPVDIRVTRVSDDPDSVKKQNLTYWFSYTEIFDEKLSYPNTALAWFRFSARNFNSIPERKYLIRGIKVQIPLNGSVDTVTHKGRVVYNGIWNGDFQAATWCSDPAWCLWDLLTNTRYGAGIPESSLDRYDFYAISQYCNELVSDGYGGVEPRFSCNLLINDRNEIYTVIQEFVSMFRGIAYYSSGSMTVIADRASDPQYLLGPSNVVDGIFTYSGSSQKTRHTTATVSYQTYESLGEVQFEYVEDPDSVAKYGIINKDIRAIGCYSRGQAHRLGKWALLTEQYLTETVSFSVGIDSGVVLRPGMVISVADPVKSGSRRSGRISAATTTTVTVDNTSGLPTNTINSPVIFVMMPTGNVESRPVSAISGNVLTVASPFSEAPNVNSVFAVETNDLKTNLFRVVSVAENDQGVFGVTALSYNPSIYNAIENDISLEFRDITNLSIIPDPPTGLQAIEYLYIEGQSILTAVELSWVSPVQRVSGFRVSYKNNNGNWQVVETDNPSVTLRDVQVGLLYVEVSSLSTIGKASIPATATFQVFGKTAPPGNVQNLTIEPISANSARLRWDATVDLDVRVGGRVIIRHSHRTDGSGTWSNSIDLIPAVPGYSTETIVPLVEGEILVKFEDDGGRQSLSETSVVVDFPDALGQFLVQSVREDLGISPFQGNRIDVFYNDDLDGLTINGDASFDEQPDVDLIETFDFLGNIKQYSEYEFLNTLDLEQSYAIDLQRYFITRGYYPGSTINNRTELVDDWSEWDGAIVNKVNARLYMRRTADDPTGLAPAWSPWQEFVNGTFVGRAFQFKASLESNDNAQNIVVDELGYQATFQRRLEQSDGIVTSSAGTTTISFFDKFFTGTPTLGGVNVTKPAIGIVAQDMDSGDYFRVTSVTATSFNVTFYNSSNAAIVRNFLWSAVGYGKAA